VKQGSVDAVYQHPPLARSTSAAGSRSRTLEVRSAVAFRYGRLQVSLLDAATAVVVFDSGSTCANFCNRVQWLPWFLSTFWFGIVGTVSKASRGESTLSPAVVNTGKVPVNAVGSGVSVKVVAGIDESLHGGDVNVVNGGEVENDGLECGAVVFVEVQVTGSLVVPRTVTETGETVGGCASTLLLDVIDQFIAVVGRVGVDVTVGEAVNEHAGEG